MPDRSDDGRGSGAMGAGRSRTPTPEPPSLVERKMYAAGSTRKIEPGSSNVAATPAAMAREKANVEPPGRAALAVNRHRVRAAIDRACAASSRPAGLNCWPNTMLMGEIEKNNRA